jgi:hypothetical protein
MAATRYSNGRQVCLVRFQSVLFEHPDDGEEASEPDYFGDLNLDRVVASITGEFGEYALAPFFYRRLSSADAVRYRHDVLHDLEKPDVAEALDAFTEGMRRVRRRRTQIEKLHYRLQKQRWFADMIECYCGTVRAFAEHLARLDVTSAGLTGLEDYLAEYVDSETFAALENETRQVKKSLGGIHYFMHVRGARVTVSRYQGEADYGAEIERTFAKFRHDAAKDHRVELEDPAAMNPVEQRVLELVARLHPDEFAELDAYCRRHGDYLDTTVGTFDREVQFYRAYLHFLRRFTDIDLATCYPTVSEKSSETTVAGAFDIALADKLVSEQAPVVRNDIALGGGERIVVVTGPNQGGKTTFARMVGQLHHLASLGLPVPGREVRLGLPDRIFTHFEREEELETLRGKLEDELARVHDILASATEASLVVMNESFSSTTLQDARFLGGEILHRIVEKGSLAVYVTFVDELASLGSSTVSMVATVDPEDPAVRTYQVVRKPPDGLAYAEAIAKKYGLTYESLRRRMSA